MTSKERLKQSLTFSAILYAIKSGLKIITKNIKTSMAYHLIKL